MIVQYCDRCGITMKHHTSSISHTYRGVASGREDYLCEECTHKFEQWIYCDNIEDRLERVADRLERIVGDTDESLR